MKLKGLTKLALSGVALAAVAATLGTSTYAWYVTNSTATVEGVQGAAKAGGLGNVLVAENSSSSSAKNGHGEFVQDITLNTGNITTTTTAAGLIPALPVTALNATTANLVTAATLLNSSTKWVDVEGKEIESGIPFIQFDVWLLSTDATTVNFSYTIENTTASTALVNQIAYAASGLPTNVSQGQTFNVNIVDALRMGFTQTDFNADNTSSTTATKSVILDVASAATSVTNAYNGYTTGGNANGYYKAVLGSDSKIVEAATTTVSTTVTPITVAANQETKLSFYIWLEGSDAQCFDSCSGQTFELHFSFDTNQQ